MDILKKRILEDGLVLEGNILKVDNFLNHQIDVGLLDEMAHEFHRLFSGEKITKILTVESSGISVACAVGRVFGVPVLFAKKGNSRTLSESTYREESYSFTKKESYVMNVSKKYLSDADTILIIDDFLANGLAIDALLGIITQSGARLAGVGIVIEKAFQLGGKKLREKNIRLESLAIIASMANGKITFKE
ncbi:MAG: xanthine phosphoribosyltransferase [Clostridia bacterium]